MTDNQEGIAEGYLSACEQENRELRAENERLRAVLNHLRDNWLHVFDPETRAMIHNALGKEPRSGVEVG